MNENRYKNIANKAFDWFAEHYDGRELYDILHEHLEMTNAEIRNVGFDLDSMANGDIEFHDLGQ